MLTQNNKELLFWLAITAVKFWLNFAHFCTAIRQKLLLFVTLGISVGFQVQINCRLGKICVIMQFYTVYVTLTSWEWSWVTKHPFWEPPVNVLLLSSLLCWPNITWITGRSLLMNNRIHPWQQPCSCKTQCWNHLSSDHHLYYKERVTHQLVSHFNIHKNKCKYYSTESSQITNIFKNKRWKYVN